jgi:hypothetical protein
MRLTLRLHALATSAAPAPSLAWTRIAVGAAALVKLASVAPLLWQLTAPGSVQVPFGSVWLDLSRAVALGLLVVWSLAAASLVVGWHSRAAAGALAVAAWFTLLADQQLYSNHLYMLALLASLLALVDSGAVRSLDARRRGPKLEVVGYPLALIRFLVAILYGFTALAKVNLVWLSGAVLGAHLGTGPIPFPDGLLRFEVLAPLAMATLLVEGFLAGGLFVRRWRKAAVLCGVSLHVGIVAFMGPTLELTAFGLMMLGTYPLFFADPAPQPEERAVDTPGEPAVAGAVEAGPPRVLGEVP